ncbi:hypothetical protein H4W33_005393 [Kibdelosporangium phytohabitans]|nr:hypothetical protein [Kibdelosporangium phytohabitans]
MAPLRFTTMIDEAESVRPVGGPDVMREQVLHLAEAGGRRPYAMINR